jgi:hypothetical protein
VLSSPLNHDIFLDLHHRKIIFPLLYITSRGPTLETVVVRMRIFCEAYALKIKEAESQREVAVAVDAVKAVQKSV